METFTGHLVVHLALRIQLCYWSQHLLSCSKHSELGFLRGCNRKGPDPLPSVDLNLHPNRQCASCKERELVNSPLPGHELTGADPAQGRDPSGHSSAHRGHRRAPPARFLARADPEPLRAGPGRTDNRSWVSDPGLRSAYSEHQDLQKLLLRRAVSPPTTPLCRTPGFLSLGEGLLETASYLRAR